MSTVIDVHEEGANALIAEVGQVDKTARPGVLNAMFRRMAQIRQRVRWYPPELRGQHYRRTGTYGRGWHIFRLEGSGGGIANAQGWVLQGLASQRGRVYTKYVGGDVEGLSQAEIHQDRWRLLRLETDDALAGLEDDVADAVANAVVRRGRFE